MFKTIVDLIKKEKDFERRGIYLENRENYFLTIIPKEEEVYIQWKNGSLKKKSYKLELEDDKYEKIDQIYDEWKNETNKSNKILNLFNKDKEYFIEKAILIQKKFRKNIRKFEFSLREKIKKSNDRFDENDINYLTLYSFIKQFKIKLSIDGIDFSSPFNQNTVIIKDKNREEVIRNSLEFKLIINDFLSDKQKEYLKTNFQKDALNYLSKHVDTDITGIKRLLNSFKV